MTKRKEQSARHRAFPCADGISEERALCAFISDTADGKAARSLLAQTDGDWQLTVLSGGGHTADGRVTAGYMGMEEAVSGAKSEYIAFLPNDCELAPLAIENARPYLESGVDAVYGDAVIDGEQVRYGSFSEIDMFSGNILGGFLAVRKELAVKAGMPKYLTAAELYAYAYRLMKLANSIKHIPKIMCALQAQNRETASILRRTADSFLPDGWRAMQGLYSGSLRIRPTLKGDSAVAIIIPCQRDFENLRGCLTALEANTLYPNKEYIIADMGCEEPRLRQYFSVLERNRAAKVISFSRETPFADALNASAGRSHADCYIFLSPYCRASKPDWIESLLEACVMGRVGAAGPMLTDKGGAIVHAGLVVGLRGWFDSPFAGARRSGSEGAWRHYVERLRRVSALSARCMLVPADAFWSVTGFGSGMDFGYDVDLCLRLDRAGYSVVYTPFSRLICSSFISDDFPIAEAELRKCYDSIRGTLITGDPYISPIYDMRYTVLRPASKIEPPINLNPFAG